MPFIPLHLLIQLAYGATDFQIVGEPPWANSDGYDVTAKAEGNLNFEQMRPMLQSLLTDRFKLKFHRETKDLPVYELTVAKGGLKIAPGKDGNCVEVEPNGPRPPFGSKICGGVRTGMGSIEGFGVTMAKLAELLADRVGRTVIDKTGFIGTFNFRLVFTPDEPGPATADDPSLFAASQEQLGLQLKSTKGPVEVLVIDHVERPSEN